MESDDSVESHHLTSQMLEDEYESGSVDEEKKPSQQ
jgi:hypothetical protein